MTLGSIADVNFTFKNISCYSLSIFHLPHIHDFWQFKNISCYSLSFNAIKAYITIVDLKTSHVTVYPSYLCPFFFHI